MVTIVRTNSENKDFIELVKSLDAFLTIADGDDHDFYDQYNNIDALHHVVVAYKDEKPLGCGAIKKYDNESIEIKRMYVNPEFRGHGIATKILKELEVWAKELGYKKCILETGKVLKGAIKLYQTNDYKLISNYEPYKNVLTSVCFEKQL